MYVLNVKDDAGYRHFNAVSSHCKYFAFTSLAHQTINSQQWGGMSYTVYHKTLTNCEKLHSQNFFKDDYVSDVTFTF